MNGDRRLRVLSKIYRSLVICLALLGLIIICGSIFGLFFQNNPPTQAQAGALPNKEEGQIFTGIGQIRVSIPDANSLPADSSAKMVVISVAFIYDPDDKAFSEELAFRVRDFRQIITDYFSSFSALEIQNYSEEKIKADLLSKLNLILRLGKINSLFFSDFMII